MYFILRPTFLFRQACPILNMANIHGINLLPAYLPNYLNVEAGYHWEGWFQSGTFFLM